MNLKAQIQHDIERHELMACYDLQGSLNIINFARIGKGEPSEVAGYRVADGVATVYVRGLLVPKMDVDFSDWGITGYNHIAEYIEQANADPMVNSIVLDIDSGGGYVAGIEGPTEAIYQSTKPIETFVSGDMYSAAYWLGASAKKITATKTSGIGSIGVYVVHAEESQALANHGITYSMFRSGKWKGSFNSFTPLSDDEKERLQQGVNESASNFFNHVAANRDLDAKTIKGWEGDTFNAQQAKDYGLIDSIASQAATYTALNTYQMSEEDSMTELEQAQAKIAELQSAQALAEQAKQAAEAKAKAAEDALKDIKAKAREAQINELAELTGKEFTAEEKSDFADMTDRQFASAFNTAKAIKESAPKMPISFTDEQANQGQTLIPGSGIDARFEAAKQAAQAKLGA
ncbi:S49 family peptidase [Psychrobacter pygoscelis]|uniref:S49 family peptidase n=1 Tax=Psychrobacter pygoscelis TaxID=2488563 RepID=UPI00103CCDEE|nr:S49 family peptidase [Psychrobacter pygoscelis]